MNEKTKNFVIWFLLSIAVLFTYYSHVVLHSTIIFTHFYYFPIILASLWWKRKGIFVAVILAVFLIISHVFLWKESEMIIDNYYRAGLFITISLILSQLAIQVDQGKKKLKKANELLEQKVYQRTELLMEANTILENTLVDQKKIIEDLKTIRKNLEIRIQRRTFELAKTSIELKEMIEKQKKTEDKIQKYRECFNKFVQKKDLSNEEEV